MTADLLNGAYLSACRTWRYTLHRSWGGADPLIVIGLNPSTADEVQDDPTIRRCIRFAKDWGHGGLVMLNLFAFRATDPLDMMGADNPAGPDNDRVLIEQTAGRSVLCAWGTHGSFMNRGNTVRRLLSDRDLRCLKLTQGGQPAHPLYLSASMLPYVLPRVAP